MSMHDERKLYTAIETASVYTKYNVRITALSNEHPLTDEIAAKILEDLDYWDEEGHKVCFDDAQFWVKSEIVDIRTNADYMDDWEEIDDPLNASPVDICAEEP